MPSRVDRNLRILMIATLVGGFAPHLAVWVVYLTNLRGLSLAQVGLMETFFWAIAIAVEVPAGAFSDRFGRRPTFIVANVAQSAGLVVLGVATNFPLLLASYVLWAGGIAFYSGNDGAYLFEVLASGGRGGEFTHRYGRLTAALNVGTLAGAIAGPLMAAWLGLAAPIVIAGVARLAALPFTLALDEPPATAGARERGGYVAALRGGWRVLRADRAAWRVALLSVSFAGVMAPGMLLLQPFLVRQEVPIAAFALVITPIRLLAIGGSLSASTLQRRLGVRVAFGAVVLGGAAVLFAIGGVDRLVAVVGFALLAFLGAITRPLLFDYLNARVPSEVRATVLSVPQLGRTIALAVLLPTLGLVATASFSGAFVVLAAALAAGGGVAFVAWLRVDGGGRRARAPLGAADRPAAEATDPSA